MTRARSMRLGLPILFAIALAPAPALAEAARLIDALVKTAGLTAKDVSKAGDKPLARELEVGDRSRSAAFAGVIRIQSDGAALTRGLLRNGVDAPNRGIFSDPAQPGDVAQLTFPDDDMKELPDCRVASCKFKLSQDGIDTARAIDWSGSGAGAEFNRRFRAQAIGYVDGYRSAGNANLIRYADKPQPVALADTIAALSREFSAFGRLAPGFVGYLNSYPGGRRPSMNESIVWSIEDFGYRPTLAIDHVFVDEAPETEGARSLMAVKTIYANHYLAGRIQMGAVVDGQSAFGVPGSFIVLVDRIEFDDTLGSIKRSLLGRGLGSDVEDRLKELRGLADGAL